MIGKTFAVVLFGLMIYAGINMVYKLGYLYGLAEKQSDCPPAFRRLLR